MEVPVDRRDDDDDSSDLDSFADDLTRDMTTETEWHVMMAGTSFGESGRDGSEHLAINRADVLLKLCNCVHRAGSVVAARFAETAFSLACGNDATQRDGTRFGEALWAVVELCDRCVMTVDDGSSVPPDTDQEGDVSVAVWDMLRTASIALENEEGMGEKEADETRSFLSRKRRKTTETVESDEEKEDDDEDDEDEDAGWEGCCDTNQEYSVRMREACLKVGLVSNTVRHEGKEMFQSHAYAHAELVHGNLVRGVQFLRRLANKSDESLTAFLQVARDKFRSAFLGGRIVDFFDGQKLRAAFLLHRKYFSKSVDGETAEQTERIKHHAQTYLSHHGDANNFNRMLYTGFAMVAAIKRSVYRFHKDRDKSKEQIESYPESAEIARLAESISTKLSEATKGKKANQNPPTRQQVFLNAFMDWIEVAHRSKTGSTMLRELFNFKCLKINRADASEWLVDLVDPVDEAEGRSGRMFSLLEAACHLCTARARSPNGALHTLSVHNALLLAIFSFVSTWVDYVEGPFVVFESLKRTMQMQMGQYQVKALHASCAQSSDRSASSRGKKPHRDFAKDMESILEYGMREEHEKDFLSETRLQACLYHLATKESLAFDLDLGADTTVLSALSYQRPGIRRGQVLGSITTPACKRKQSFHPQTCTSYMIENPKSLDDKNERGRTSNDQLVLNPILDMQGVVVLRTVLFPISSWAMKKTVEFLARGSTKERRAGKTYELKTACERFVSELRNETLATFDADRRLVPLVANRAFAEIVFREHKGLVRSFLRVFQGSLPLVWSRLIGAFTKSSSCKRAAQSEADDSN